MRGNIVTILTTNIDFFEQSFQVYITYLLLLLLDILAIRVPTIGYNYPF